MRFVEPQRHEIRVPRPWLHRLDVLVLEVAELDLAGGAEGEDEDVVAVGIAVPRQVVVLVAEAVAEDVGDGAVEPLLDPLAQRLEVREACMRGVWR